jgi:hypothetical protein
MYKELNVKLELEMSATRTTETLTSNHRNIIFIYVFVNITEYILNYARQHVSEEKNTTQL